MILQVLLHPGPDPGGPDLTSFLREVELSQSNRAHLVIQA